MRPVAFASIGVFALFACVTPCSAKDPPRPEILPLTSLRLYETGVGYFSRAGRVDAGSSMSLPIPAGHLDDALKSLVVFSPDGKSQIAGLEFGSSLSKGMARALAGLLPESEEPLDWRAMLVSLKGAQVEVRATGGASSRGRIVDVADPPPSELKAENKAAENVKCAYDDPRCARVPAPDISVLLLEDGGQLRRFAGRAIESVRPTDAAFGVRLNAAMDALSTRAAQTEHLIRLLARGGGPVTLGYIAEAPIYRTTWRLVMGERGATLAGWVLLHNDTDEDWRGIKVDLVNGQPDSFLYPIAAPRYARRELVHPENALSTVPQLLGKTADGIWGDNLDETQGAGGFSVTGVGSGGGGSGYGSGMGSIGTVGHGGGSGTTAGASDLLGVGNLAGIAEAKGVEGGALFTYSLAQPLDLRSHGSALVPFLQQPIEAEEITFIASGEHARSGVRFTNSTKQTLPTGPIAFFAGGGFAGESSLDRLKPGERRFMQFGNDLDVELTVTEDARAEEVKRVRRNGDTIEEHYLRTTELTDAFENRAGRQKTIYTALAYDLNATVKGADGLDFDPAQKQPVAVFRVPAQKKVERKLTVVERLVRRTKLDAVTAEMLRKDLASLVLSKEARDALEGAARAVEARDAAHAQVKRSEEEDAEVARDLERLRQDLKALGEKSGVAGPLVARMVAAEDRVAVIRKRLEGEKAAEKARTEEARAALKKIL